MIVLNNSFVDAGRFIPPGDPIPGSRFYCVACRECGEPMRVGRSLARRKDLQCYRCASRHLPRISDIKLVGVQ